MSEVDLESYQGNMETVLAWLLEAEDHLSHQGSISDHVDNVKEQFHTHEVSPTPQMIKAIPALQI